MSAPTFHCEYISPTSANWPAPFSIRLDRWEVSRVGTRAVYNYLLGGRDSKWLGFGLRMLLAWEALPPADADKLHRMVTAIHSGALVRVRLSNTGADTRHAFPLLDGSGTLLPPDQRGWPVEIETDEIPESTGEQNFADEALELTLITRPRLGPAYAEAPQLAL